MKKTNRFVCLVAITAAGVTGMGFPLTAQLIGNYSFNDVVANTGGAIDPTPPPVAFGVEFSPFEAVGVGTLPRANGSWSFSGWGIDSALDPNRYFEATLSPLGVSRL